MFGRKSKYETVVKPNLELIEGWLLNGITEREIARRLRIAHSTFQAYKRQFPVGTPSKHPITFSIIFGVRRIMVCKFLQFINVSTQPGL